MGGDIPGTYAPFPYPVLIVAIEGSAGYVILGVGDEDIFCIGMDHDPVRDTDVFLATVGDKVRADHLFRTDIYDPVRDGVALRIHVPFRTVIEEGISADAKVGAGIFRVSVTTISLYPFRFSSTYRLECTVS